MCLKENIQIGVLAFLTVFSLVGCASVNPLGSNISVEVLMPDGTPARNVDVIVYYQRTGFVGGSEGIGARESDRKIHSRTGSFKTHFVGLLGVTGVQAFKPGWESDFYDYHSSPPPRNVRITLHRKGEAPSGVIASPPPPPADETFQPPTVYRPLPPTAARHGDIGQTMGVADVKLLVKDGLSDEVIISQIRSTRTRFHLKTAEIIGLKESGVSDAIIDFMINTGRGR